jgi:hypothetical protein
MNPPPIQPGSHRRKAVRLLLKVFATALIAYVVLLVPDREGALPAGAGRVPFAWRQDWFWSKLEGEFVAARAAEPARVRERVQVLFSALESQIGEIFKGRLAPEAPIFPRVETNLFEAGPLVAALPDRLGEYVALANRLRQAVKEQSLRWDLESREARQTLYRLLQGARMAVEEVIIQAGTNHPIDAVCTAEPSQTLSTPLLDVPFHSGDILVSRGDAPTSALISRGNDYPGSFSHVSLVYVDAATGKASLVEALLERGVVVRPVEELLAKKKSRFMLMRLRADLPAVVKDPQLPHRAAAAAFEEANRTHIPYDFTMDYRDHRARFCSEVVAAAYAQAGISLWMRMSSMSSETVIARLGSLGVRHFETMEPADLEYDPQLRVVAEWRTPDALLKAHVDDAVTDVMLDDPRADARHYPGWLLPISRLVKAYSYVANKFGRTGPVPEGMSATVALRADKFRSEHKALADRLLLMTTEFQRARGYQPPYWELVRMARQAKEGRSLRPMGGESMAGSDRNGG